MGLSKRAMAHSAAMLMLVCAPLDVAWLSTKQTLIAGCVDNNQYYCRLGWRAVFVGIPPNNWPNCKTHHIAFVAS